MDESAPEYQSPNFIFRFPPNSLAEKHIHLIANRMQSVLDEALKVLDLALPDERIHVYLSEMEEVDLPDEIQEDGRSSQSGRMAIRAIYRSDAPGQGLERSLIELLLRVCLGERASRSTMVVDGLLGHVSLQIGQLDSTKLKTSLSEALSEGQRISVADVLRGPTAESKAHYHQIVTDFSTYLLTTYGSDRFKQFAQEFDPESPDTATEIAYGKPLSTLEKEWIRDLGKAQPQFLSISGFLRVSLTYLLPHWRLSILIFVLMGFGIAFSIIMPFSMKFLINDAILPKDNGQLAKILIFLGILFLFGSMATMLKDYLVALVGARLMVDLRFKMFNHLQSLSMNFYSKSQIGDIMTRFTADVSVVESAMLRAIPSIIVLLVSAIISSVLLVREQWLLSAILAAGFPVFIIGPRLLGARAAKASYERQQTMGVTASMLQENLSGQAVVKAFSLQEQSRLEFQSNLDELARRTRRVNFLGSALGTSAGLSGSMIQLMGLGIGSYLTIRGDFTLGALMAFLALLGNVIAPLGGFSGIVQVLQAATGGMHRVQELLNEPPQIVDADDASPLPRLSREIRFEGVSFSYTGEQQNLKKVDLTIPVGHRVAFVGPSGCGKSTLLNLLMRYYDPDEGSVKIDGHDIRTVTEKSLHGQIGSVLQDNFLFNVSFRENIRMGNLDATDEEVETAAKIAEIHDIIQGFPDGYENVVGERGGRLSGGQRQRIAIARAIVRDPSILVLDEATSALDPGTEAAINATLEQLGKQRTVISVTHRLTSVVNADRIYVLDEGELVEQGTHQELLDQKGLYLRLWEQQNGFIIAEGEQAEGDQYVGVEATRLQAIPMFHGMDGVLLAALANNFMTERFDEDETIFEEGEAGYKMYIVVRGQVEVLTTGPTGEERRLAVLRDGDYFGEMALLEDIPRTATVRARAPTILLTLEREQFNHLLSSVPDLRLAFEQIIDARREANMVTVQP
ncbi:MAG: ATP-binding cassette domain-containing protein [Chloroflexi bacterium]|nr:ATP-binding cassette domain-containing protein [Chloroflexota bacterium]